jgi:flagellar operon protein
MNNRLDNINSDIRLKRTGIIGGASIKGLGVQQPSMRPSFEEVLEKISPKPFDAAQSNGVKFSKHAIQRLESRNIELSSDDMARIREGFAKAEGKGIKEALILMNEKVFIANIKNKMIITASTERDLQNNVFTNIDGAVIV